MGNLRIPSVMLFQTACSVRASLVSRSQTAFARRERLCAAGCPVARVWTAIIDLPVPGASAQAAHRHYTRPFLSWRNRSGYARLQAPKVDRTPQNLWTNHNYTAAAAPRKVRGLHVRWSDMHHFLQRFPSCCPYSSHTRTISSLTRAYLRAL